MGAFWLTSVFHRFPRGHSPNLSQSPAHTPFSDLSADKARQVLQTLDRNSQSPLIPSHSRVVSDPVFDGSFSKSSRGRASHEQQRPAMPLSRKGSGPAPVQIKGDTKPVMHRTTPSNESLPAPRPSISLAPNKLTSFFSWKGSASSPVAENSPTTLSDKSHSPGPSPRFPSPRSFSSSSKSIPHAIDTSKANATASYFTHLGHPLPPPTPAMSMKMEEMEEELKEISAELAASIRREMELEDEVERLQLDGPTALEPSRRTSDYFSDSGTSSVRYPLSENGNKADAVEKIKRRSEQEVAQLKLDTSQKLQDERARRKAMEAHIKNLEEQLESVDRNQPKTEAVPGRVRELEVALEDNRRRLQEERQHKENYEDLLTALRGDIEHHRNERDNLRDEVVPQLRARVEGLEMEAAGFQQLTYDHTKMQQEVQALKNENNLLRTPRFRTIEEEDDVIQTPRTGLSRSSSLARGTASAKSLARSGSLRRSSSILTKDQESRESLSERVKEIEAQRDALHQALKSLLDRQKHQNREHEKRLRVLEQERDRALEAHSPRRRGYEAEVKELRYEINELRRRADEALEQKWQCEKGLGGLKKDLDRAEQETGSLRTLLHEHDILIPEELGNSPAVRADTQATSASLEKAYKELQATQALSVVRLRELKGITPSGDEDATTARTMDMLIKTMSDAEAERDLAQKQVETYRAQATSLQEAKEFHENENANLAAQLRASADRMEALASQVRHQLDANSGLRARLAEAVGRGEREQKASAARINNIQSKLRALEDRLMVAQQHSEEVVQMHEDEVKELRDSHNLQLQRLKPLRSPTSTLFPTSNMGSKMSPRSPRSPMMLGARSPRLGRTSSGMGITMNEAMKTEFLEKRVKELESALKEADKEMQEVVQRMNQAQIEGMELQSARYAYFTFQAKSYVLMLMFIQGRGHETNEIASSPYHRRKRKGRRPHAVFLKLSLVSDFHLYVLLYDLLSIYFWLKPQKK